MTVALLPAFAQQIPRQTQPTTGAIEGRVVNSLGLGVGGVSIDARNLDTGAEVKCTEFGNVGDKVVPCQTNGDGVFRIRNLRPGRYEVKGSLTGFESFSVSSVEVPAGRAFPIGVTMKENPWPEGSLVIPHKPGTDPPPSPAYRLMIDTTLPNPLASPEEAIAPSARVFEPVPDRWKYQFPDYKRYPNWSGELPWTGSSFIDPFSRNKLKGDYPIFGQRTFLNVQLASNTIVDQRRIPLPSNLGSSRPGSEEFFGKFKQSMLVENVSLSATLFRGDTVFRPIDWQFRFTPEFNINYLKVGENGIVNIDVRKGTDRTDTHIGLQEAFFEIKLKDLSGAYDFVSARAGIQTFNSDFRGFIFNDQEPGFRVFGNFKANRYIYNLAYFNMLEKDTNSALNRLESRGQQVFIANLYRQDFLKLGYTIQTSFHYNKDDASLEFDQNNFLARPAPIGTFRQHKVRSYYFGLAGDGHIGRINVNHAFYQVIGHESENLLAPPKKEISINAQMAALELSIDKDWIRYKTSIFYASGDANPRDGSGRGFDAIFDAPNFSGGIFSFWNREGIRLLSTGVALVNGDSLLPNLRSSKIQGQSNFINPGIYILNVGADIDITPKMRGFININNLRFDKTAPLELLLFQKPIHAGLGLDNGVGVLYRPPLSDNIIITAAFNTFVPYRGFKEILNSNTLFSVFASVKFKF
ncbi:MAG TPA: carboxypeptidase-like regulatory domain-containing protein [Bryobacteraceae bacterium]|nr:carboxypeptidase-like regulatory domain-containing protein [Bryobacteraceae bacterium]